MFIIYLIWLFFVHIQHKIVKNKKKYLSKTLTLLVVNNIL